MDKGLTLVQGNYDEGFGKTQRKHDWPSPAASPKPPRAFNFASSAVRALDDPSCCMLASQLATAQPPSDGVHSTGALSDLPEVTEKRRGSCAVLGVGR